MYKSLRESRVIWIWETSTVLNDNFNRSIGLDLMTSPRFLFKVRMSFFVFISKH